MRKIIILLAAMLALVGAAAADSISGTGSYTATQYLAQVGSGTQTMNTGMDLVLSASMNGVATPVAESSVNNQMALTLAQLPSTPTLVAPIVATQSGGNTIALNNGQEPGTTNPQIWDFQSTSTSGGDASYASEGVGNSVTPITTGTFTPAAQFSATSTGTEKTLNSFIAKPVTVVDTNTVTGTATPDTVTFTAAQVAGTPLSAGTYETSHIKSGDFNWACTDSANVKLEDSYTKDAIIGSGISSSSTATGESSPTFNGITAMFPALGPATGLTTTTNGLQTIAITVGAVPT